MAEPIRVDLADALAGKHVLIDHDELTVGLVEDLQSREAKALLDSLAAVIVGGDLARGTDRAGLRRLRIAECAALTSGVAGVVAVPKAT